MNGNDESKSGSHSNFLELIDTLDNVANQELYTTEFVVALIQEFWLLYYKVFDFVFIPFVAQSIACVIYFSYFLTQEVVEDHLFLQWLTKTVVYITTVYFSWLEWLQIKDKRHIYFTEVTNFIDIGSAFLNFFLIIKDDYFPESGYGFEM